MTKRKKARILRNGYTRGQIELFVAAERSYGFNEVLDWMQFGTDSELSATEPGRIRSITSKGISQAAMKLGATRTEPTTVPDTLVLKAIFWDRKRPLALINDCLLRPDEEARVRVGTSNVVVHCLSILEDSVQVWVAGSKKEQTLRLKEW